MRVCGLPVVGCESAGPQHLRKRPCVAFVALDPTALDIRRTSRVHANHRIIHRRQRPEQLRRERAASQADLRELTLEASHDGLEEIVAVQRRPH
jgi:hypothetical protein